jgi:hypothetical protein
LDAPQDITVLDKWLATAKALARDTKGLGRYAKVTFIAEAIEAYITNDKYDKAGVYVYLRAKDELAISVELKRYRSGERLAEALRGIGSPLVKQVILGRIGRAGSDRCEVVIVLAPRPPQAASPSAQTPT